MLPFCDSKDQPATFEGVASATAFVDADSELIRRLAFFLLLVVLFAGSYFAVREGV